jgi:hypothetical protein
LNTCHIAEVSGTQFSNKFFLVILIFG